MEEVKAEGQTPEQILEALQAQSAPFQGQARISKGMRGLTDRELAVRQAFPNSWFTKGGKGVEADAKRVFYWMTQENREIAVRKGWVPRSWL